MRTGCLLITNGRPFMAHLAMTKQRQPDHTPYITEIHHVPQRAD